MKQILTILISFGALSLASATVSAGVSPGNILELETQSTKTTLNARDALGMVAECYGYGGGGYGGTYQRSYSYAPVRRTTSYYRGGGGRSYGGFGGYPYGGGRRGFSSGFGSYGRGGYGRGYGCSAVGLFLSF